MKKAENFYALVLAGGVGSRLWPKSRKKMPKHLLKLHSDDTMLQEAIKHVEGIIPPERIFIVTRQDHVEEIKKQVPQIDKKRIIVEPKGKNTAWAMGLGARYIERHDPNAVIVNVAADHVIRNVKNFEQSILAAYEAANKGEHLITIGIVPTYAHTGLGYIRVGKEFDEINGLPVFQVLGFHEKPNLPTAQAFIASKEYFWNANLYTWHVKAIRSALEKHLPELSSKLDEIEKVIDTPKEKKVLESVYENAEEIQIDKGVSEKAKNLLMIPGDFGWSDIGDWSVLHEVKASSPDATVIIGDQTKYLGIDTKGSLVQIDNKIIATIGLQDIVVIDTPDALLICQKSRVQDVKKIVEQLKKDKRTELL